MKFTTNSFVLLMMEMEMIRPTQVHKAVHRPLLLSDVSIYNVLQLIGELLKMARKVWATVNSIKRKRDRTVCCRAPVLQIILSDAQFSRRMWSTIQDNIRGSACMFFFLFLH